MKQFAAWVTGRVYRAGLVAAALALIPPFGVIGSAVLVLATLRNGSQAGWGGALVGTAVLLLLSLAGGANPVSALFAALVFWAPAIGLAALLRRTGSLSTALQGAVIGGLLLAGSWVLAIGTGDSAWTQTLAAELQPLLEGAGAGTRELVILIMPGVLAGSLMLAALLALFLGMWLQAGLSSPGAFGKAFRECRLGQVIAALTVVIMLAGFATRQVAFANLLMVAMSALVIQGLAVIHGLAHLRGWSQGVLVAVYVVLIFGVSLAAPLLAVAGLLDNWGDFRRRGTPTP
jgi:hypothetical protein